MVNLRTTVLSPTELNVPVTRTKISRKFKDHGTVTNLSRSGQKSKTDPEYQGLRV